MLVGVPLLVASTRWYLRRGRAGYLREMAAYARLNGTVTETVDGARTVDALRLAAARRRRVDDDLRRDASPPSGTRCRLRTVWYPVIEFGYMLPVGGDARLGRLAGARRATRRRAR